MLRKPAVAGQFYSENPDELRRELMQYLAGEIDRRKVTGIIVPHAGYIYSGQVAADVYKIVEIPHTVLLLGPDHHGLGGRATVFSCGVWQTPFGEVPVAEDLAARLIHNCEMLETDEPAHRFEHSLEVQIPFLQMLQDDLHILPISLGHAELSDWLELGRQIGQVLQEWHEPVLLVASTDMNHFKPAEQTERIDKAAIEQMEKFNPAGLYSLVKQNNISMCGVVPATILLEAAKVLGAESCQLVTYNHSGKINGDMGSVVGYASLIVE